MHARTFCQMFGMEILSFETKLEQDHMFQVLKNFSQFLDNENSIGGISLTPRSTTDWYWVNSGKKVKFLMGFMPGQPDHYNGAVENCLAINKYGNGFGLNDWPCYGHAERKFICQLDEIF